MTRRFIKSLAHGLGNLLVPPVGRLRGRQDRFFILTWHSFATRWVTGLIHAQPVALFERQLDWLKKHFIIVALEDGLSGLGSGFDPLGRPRLAITLDDGYANNYALAYPALRARNLPATIFVATDFVDSGRAPWTARLRYILEHGRCRKIEVPLPLLLATARQRAAAAIALKSFMTPLPAAEREAVLSELACQCDVADWETAIKPMTWGELREMSGFGITIGAHGHHHSILPSMPMDLAKADMALSRDRIEAELNQPCTVFAYPDGKHNQHVRQAARSIGFRFAVTQDRGSNCMKTDRFAMRRIDIPHHDPFNSFIRRVCLP